MSYPTRQDTGTIWIWVIWIALIIVGIIAVSFVFGWVTLPFQLGSTQNVQTQFTEGYTQYNGLKATARMVCDAQKAYNDETDPNAKTQRQTQLSSVQSNYARLAAEYDAWASNIFKGQVVRPADLPSRSPTLSQMQSQVCNQ